MDKNRDLYSVAKKYRRAKRAKKKMTVMSTIFLSVAFVCFVAGILIVSLTEPVPGDATRYAPFAGGGVCMLPGAIFLAILIKSVCNIRAISKEHTEKELEPYVAQVEKDIIKRKLEIERAKREREAHYNAFHPTYTRGTGTSVGGASAGSSTGGASGGSFGTQAGYYKDSRGITRKVGEDFFDSEGIYRRAGESYFDGKGEMRSAGEEFYDAKGELRSPGESFYDEK